MGEGIGNSKGHFEDLDVYEFNEHKLLPALGVSWDSLVQPDWTRVSASQLSRLAMDALQIVRRNFGSTPISILKDPRIGVTLQFWLSVFARAEIAVKPVFVVRDPLSVARSLRCRNDFSLAKGSALYTHYVTSISDLLSGSDAAWLHYDELLERPEPVLRGLATKLGIDLPSDFNRRLEIFECDFIDPTLRHSSVTLSDLGLEPELVPASVELYSHLLARVKDEDQGQLNASAARLREDMAKWAPLFAEHDALLRERSAAVEVTKQERQSFEEKLRATESTLHETGRALQEVRDQLGRSQVEAQEQIRNHAVARGALAERITLLSEKSEEAERARAREQALSESLVQELRGSMTAAIAREQSLNGQKEQLQYALDHAKNELAESLAENQRLSGRFKEAEATHSRCLSDLNATVQSQTSALNAAKAQNLALCGELEDLQRSSAERVAHIERELEEAEATHSRCLSDLNATVRSQTSALNAAKTQNLALCKELEDLRRSSAERVTHIESERDALRANVDERFRELAQIARMIIERDEKIAQQEESLRTQASALERSAAQEAVSQEQAAALEAAHGQIGRLSEELDQTRQRSADQITGLERQRAALQANVDERFRELAHMAQIFMHKDLAIEEGRATAARMKASLSWKATKPLRWIGASFGAGAKEKKRLRRQCAQLEQSGLFDAAWYTGTYPDVLESGMDPAEHYLRHGAKEGRNPGPRFNTQNYLRRYPDVAKAVPPINPLLHYVLHGKKEGRLA
jgi:hypothetical protein